MAARISGEMKTWHKTTLDFVSDVKFTENASTFRDYRLDVTFTHAATGTKMTVPGFFAADGDAADTNATSGNIWRVNFNAPLDGKWTYEASFRTGNDIAASTSSSAGRAVSSIDGESATISISKSDKTGDDFRAKGMILQDEGTHYLQHQGDGDYFVRGGPGVPENFLASSDIDNTPGRHNFSAHSGDSDKGDPTWDGGKGKNLLGAVNYLAENGQNSAYVMLMTAAGDGRDVWPWAATDLAKLSMNTRNLDPDITSVYDVSKLSQWETIFDHMDKKGIYKNLLLQEQENDQLLNGGTGAAGTSLSVERLIYIREMIARFGHNNGVQWNLGEESTNTAQERQDMAEWMKAVDPYDHLVVSHSFTDELTKVYNPLLGVDAFDGTSFQATAETVRDKIETYRDKSDANGDPWVLAWDEDSSRNAIIESGSNNPDSANEKTLREAFWGTLTAGGSGGSWYIRASGGQSLDQNMDNFKGFQSLWTWTAAATDFYNDRIPFWTMSEHDELTLNGGDYVMADPGNVYTIYLPYGDADDVRLDLSKYGGQSFDVSWYNPRTGGKLIADGEVSGGSVQQIGGAPSESGKDWVLLVENSGTDSGSGKGSGSGQTDGASTPPPAEADGYYLEKNGLVKVQFEDIVGNAKGWVYQNGSNGNNPGFEGNGYYYWRDEASTGLDKTAGQGTFTTTVYIQEAGTYNLFLRAARDSNNPSDARNDLWVKVDDGTVAVMPNGSPPMITSNGFVKLYGLNSDSAKDWHYAENFDDKDTNKNPASKVVLDKGFHTVTFSGRSDGFHIDSFQLTKNSNPNTSAVSSEYVTGDGAPADGGGSGTPPETPKELPGKVGSIDAKNDSATTAEGSEARIFVLENDSEGVWIGDFTQADNGSVTKAGGGRLVYTPDTGFAGTDSFTYTAVDGTGGSDTASVTVTVGDGSGTTPKPEPEPEPKPEAPLETASQAVNAGGDSLVIGGTEFSTDGGVNGGKLYETTSAIAGTKNDALYQSERYGDFSYTFKVENGVHDVTLKLAENYFDAAGERIFDVIAEGNRIIDDLDIFAEAGGKDVVYDITIPVRVTDGKLDLTFVSEVNYAKINGIVISSKGTDAAQPDSDTTGDQNFKAPFDLSGPSLSVGDTFLFGFGTDGKAAEVKQSGSQLGVADAGSGTEMDYRKASSAGSEMIGFDFGKAVTGMKLDLDGMSVVDGATEAAILRIYDAAGAEIDEFLLKSNSPTTLGFDAPVRFASLESSPWLSNGSLPSTEPDFSLQDFDVFV